VTAGLAQRDLKNFPFLIVLAIEVGAFGYVALSPQHWLRAVGGIAFGLFVAGLERLVLSDRQAGFLRVRQRHFDVACYLCFGVLVLTLGLALPQR
jgi:hypothetical protein